ncbi:PREDICTED: uncharacterized protein LOC108368603 [Rhagoletis zephyria]|uniref:uncharacterized protein LOC108368603 n=1 Tax=Rhagoletis zephyria TaxID=28612 RepID=UPI0008118EDF|nr:PREDICTED: uncharacterized protein LOC108368603 [Rhagoletis zephyria]
MDSTATVQANKDSEWTEVKKKEKRPKPKNVATTGKLRPDAIIIEKKGESSYADILKKVKSDENFKSFGDSVSKIRRTQKGDLLIELAKSCPKSAELKALVSATLGDDASVKTFTHRILVECKDIDEVTTKEEVYNAIKSLPGLEGIESSDITGLRPAYAGTQTATISLPAPKAKKLIQLGKVKVGWDNCRIRERVQLKKCFKCLQYGHMSRNCGSSFDRSNQC